MPVVSKRVALTEVARQVFPKTCRNCGRTYSEDRWSKLRTLGTVEGLEYRDCPCGNTLVVPAES